MHITQPTSSVISEALLDLHAAEKVGDGSPEDNHSEYSCDQLRTTVGIKLSAVSCSLSPLLQLLDTVSTVHTLLVLMRVTI